MPAKTGRNMWHKGRRKIGSSKRRARRKQRQGKSGK